VYEDWVFGVHVYGWEWSSGDITYLTFVRAYSGSVVCTASVIRDIWDGSTPVAKHVHNQSLVAKALAARAPAGVGASAHDADLAAAYPTLHEFLTLSVLPEGGSRSTATLLVFVDGGLWKAVLNDRESGLQLWASGESHQGLLAELESRLTAPVVDWRVQRRTSDPVQPRKVDRKPRG
jgi:hypothetical protein